jgi:hypothetical protein
MCLYVCVYVCMYICMHHRKALQIITAQIPEICICVCAYVCMHALVDMRMCLYIHDMPLGSTGKHFKFSLPLKYLKYVCVCVCMYVCSTG